MLLAPGFDPDALEILQAKKNVRLLELPDWPAPSHEVEGKPVIGGQLVQTRDVVSETREQMRAMSAGEPSDAQWEDMLFAWRVCRHVRSNAIVIASRRRHDRHRRRTDEPRRRRRASRSRRRAPLSPSCWPAPRSPPTPSSRSPTVPSSRSTPA